MDGLDMNVDYDTEFADTVYSVTSVFGVALFIIGVITEILLIVDMLYAISTKFRERYLNSRFVLFFVSKETKEAVVSDGEPTLKSMKFRAWLKMHKSFAFITIYLVLIGILMILS